MSYCRFCGNQTQGDTALCPACKEALKESAPGVYGAEEAAGNSESESNQGRYQHSFNEEGGYNEKMANFFEKLKDSFFNAEDNSYKYSPTDISKAKGVSAIAYIPFLFFLPLLAEKGSPFGRFHANQGLLATLCWVLAWLISSITFIGAFAAWLLRIVLVIAIIMSLINTASGKAKRLPFIGGIELIK